MEWGGLEALSSENKRAIKGKPIERYHVSWWPGLGAARRVVS